MFHIGGTAWKVEDEVSLSMPSPPPSPTSLAGLYFYLIFMSVHLFKELGSSTYVCMKLLWDMENMKP